jgi:hypothetical protein
MIIFIRKADTVDICLPDLRRLPLHKRNESYCEDMANDDER